MMSFDFKLTGFGSLGLMTSVLVIYFFSCVSVLYFSLLYHASDNKMLSSYYVNINEPEELFFSGL